VDHGVAFEDVSLEDVLGVSLALLEPPPVRDWVADNVFDCGESRRSIREFCFERGDQLRPAGAAVLVEAVVEGAFEASLPTPRSPRQSVVLRDGSVVAVDEPVGVGGCRVGPVGSYSHVLVDDGR
jgi:hypothetical protein